MQDDDERATSGRRSRWWAPVDVVDVFVYVTILNLAVEYLPAVITETFTQSLLTAVLLKVVLDVVVRVKSAIVARFRAADAPLGKVVAGVGLWLVLVGSKFVVLELVALVFGDRVRLGGFVPVTGLVLTLMVARLAMRRLLRAET